MPSTVQLEDRAEALIKELGYLDSWVLVNALTHKLNRERSSEGKPILDNQSTFHTTTGKPL